MDIVPLVTTLGRRTLLWMIPLNLLLVAWVWLGRGVFGVFGWFMVMFTFSVVPILLLALLVTTVLALTQPGRPRALTRTQAWAQITMWLGMLLFGLFMPDFGDAPDSELSVLTQVFGPGDGLLGVSYLLALALAALTLVAWVVLLVALTGGRRRSS